MKQNKLIRWSTWYVVDTKTKQEYKVEKVLVAGNQTHLLAISKSPTYLARMYEKLFKIKKIDVKRLKIKRIELTNKTFGMGVGCL